MHGTLKNKSTTKVNVENMFTTVPKFADKFSTLTFRIKFTSGLTEVQKLKLYSLLCFQFIGFKSWEVKVKDFFLKQMKEIKCK